MQDTWNQVRDIVEAALELPADRRTEYLDLASLEPDLRTYVDSLLLNYNRFETSPGFLDDPGATIWKSQLFSADDHTSSATGRTIGHYLLLEELGEGGMGIVYRAIRSDEQYQKQVAIKIAKTGFESIFGLERFRTERQILANMEHPNIARLIDGGTTEDGSPYFVMELIDGQPIDQYCNAHALNIPQRLRLFGVVCSAVQYAHQNLVIHRDLKPGNICVTPDGIPKLLDFGIAKILDSSTLSDPGSAEDVTGFMRMLTLEYASPEQICGDPISTASDVYSLGVILYLLLSGHHPYSFSIKDLSPQLAMQAICEMQPLPPSEIVRSATSGFGQPPASSGHFTSRLAQKIGRKDLSRQLAGDLDKIVLTALHTEQNQRYASVEQLSEDIWRYLDGLPVKAHKNTVDYRTWKFVRRHIAIVSAALLVTASLAIGMVTTQREARIARAERAKAERRFNDVRKLANSLIFDVYDSIKDLPGATRIRRLLVEQALEYLNGLSAEAAGDTSLQRELATAYERVGDVQGNPHYASLGDTVGALNSYRKAVFIRETLYNNDSTNRHLQSELAGSLFKMSSCMDATGDYPGALLSLRKSLALVTGLTRDSSDPRQLDQLAGNHFEIASVLTDLGDLQGALDNFRRAIDIRKSAGAAVLSQNVLLRTHLAGDYSGMAQVLNIQGKFALAINAQEQTTAIMQALAEADPTNATLRHFLGTAREYLAQYQEGNRQWDKALDNYRAARDIFMELSAKDPADALNARYLAFTEGSIGRVWVEMGSPLKGLYWLQRAFAKFQSLVGKMPDNDYVQAGIADTHAATGSAYKALAQGAGPTPEQRLQYWHTAREQYQKGLDIWLQMRNRSALAAEDARKPQKLEQQIATCDAAVTWQRRRHP